MGKYITAYKNALSSAFQYRLNLGLLLVSHLVSLSGLLYLWIAVYDSGQTVGNYTLSGIILYYVVLTVLRVTISEGVGMGFQVSEEINKGDITHYLLKPFSYTLERFLKLVATSTINMIVMGPIILILAIIFRNAIPFPNTGGWALFGLFTFIGLAFYFLIYYLTALSAFWVHRGGSFIYGVLLFAGFLNGSVLPLDLFPAWFQPMSNMLPFQFLIFVPIQAFLGRLANPVSLFMTALVWITVFSLLIWFTWNRGVRKYEAVGR
ncbi:MAG: ABC-2 family transporter protein [Candidatus Magasanikbacteria bacterium]